MSYLRKVGENARYFARDPNTPWRRREIIKQEGLQFGDILYDVGEYRAFKTYYVDAEGEPVHVGDVGQGSGQLELEVTQLIEDPLEFYGENPPGDIVAIYLDPKAHAKLLQKFSGGRDVHESCYVYATEGCRGWSIMINVGPRTYELTKDTPDIYLNGGR